VEPFAHSLNLCRDNPVSAEAVTYSSSKDFNQFFEQLLKKSDRDISELIHG
jgi:hypothetical protein